MSGLNTLIVSGIFPGAGSTEFRASPAPWPWLSVAAPHTQHTLCPTPLPINMGWTCSIPQLIWLWWLPSVSCSHVAVGQAVSSSPGLGVGVKPLQIMTVGTEALWLLETSGRGRNARQIPSHGPVYLVHQMLKGHPCGISHGNRVLFPAVPFSSGDCNTTLRGVFLPLEDVAFTATVVISACLVSHCWSVGCWSSLLFNSFYVGILLLWIAVLICFAFQ